MIPPSNGDNSLFKSLPTQNVTASAPLLKEEPSLITSTKHFNRSRACHNLLEKPYRIILNTWLLEYACVILAILLLGTVFVLVAYFNGRPLSAWTASVTFNTILAMLATPFRGAIIFPTAAAIGRLKWLNEEGVQRLKVFERYDQATRGPLGALALFASSLKRPLATIGALIIVISLVTDAFIQASMGVKLRNIGIANVATLPVLHNYDAYSL